VQTFKRIHSAGEDHSFLSTIVLSMCFLGSNQIYAQTIPREQAVVQEHTQAKPAPAASSSLGVAPAVASQPGSLQVPKPVSMTTPTAQAVVTTTSQVAWGSPLENGHVAQQKVTAPTQAFQGGPAPLGPQSTSAARPAGRQAPWVPPANIEFCNIRANYLDANSIPYPGHLLPCECHGTGSRNSPQGCYAGWTLPPDVPRQ
jgi:hypothetical protein